MESLYKEIIELCIKGKKEGWTNLYSKITDILHEEYGKEFSSEYIRGVSRRFRKRNGLDENFEESSVDCLLDNKDERSILQEHGFDPNKFSVVNVRQSKWTDVQGNDRISSRLTVKPTENTIYSEEFVKKNI